MAQRRQQQCAEGNDGDAGCAGERGEECADQQGDDSQAAVQVIAHYKRTNGWSAAQTELNVLAGVSGSQFLASAFDPQSIMLYPIPAALTTDGYSTQWNYTLSDGDKALAAQLYPKRQATYR